MSMPALARAAGLEAKSGADRIYRLERGASSPSLHLTYSVATVLGVTVDALCARDGLGELPEAGPID